ncbi:hypothetical protein BN1723_020329, partial [Verticillium longisporum]
CPDFQALRFPREAVGAEALRVHRRSRCPRLQHSR